MQHVSRVPTGYICGPVRSSFCRGRWFWDASSKEPRLSLLDITHVFGPFALSYSLRCVLLTRRMHLGSQPTVQHGSMFEQILGPVYAFVTSLQRNRRIRARGLQTNAFGVQMSFNPTSESQLAMPAWQPTFSAFACVKEAAASKTDQSPPNDVQVLFV